MRIALRRPDDAHLHLRDGALLRAVLPSSAAHFGRAIAMPNLASPVKTAEQARAYRDRIAAALPDGADFTPLMTAYLCDDTDAADLIGGFDDGTWVAAKLYPAHATTNSAAGVTDLLALDPVLDAMAVAGMPLLVHGEVTDPDTDVFDREAAFLERKLAPLVARHPTLKVVVEHATTSEAIAFVQQASSAVAATLTPHHLLWNRNALFDGGLRPHAYCLPVLKRARHQRALRAAATSGDPRFFLGTDSAPHLASRKECDHGCAGVFNAPTALAAIATVFEEEGALEHLEGFCSLHMARFYGLQPATDSIALVRSPWTPPEAIDTPDGPIHCFLGGSTLPWRVEGTAGD